MAVTAPVQATEEGESTSDGSGSDAHDGWTHLSPSPDSRLIYISSSVGNDSYDGLSPERPKATINAGKALVRDGFPDWVMLKRGDTFNTGFGGWNKSGRSQAEPVVIASYGHGLHRPRLETGTDAGFITLNTTTWPLSHVALTGLHFVATGYNGSNSSPRGLLWHSDFEDVLIEDCAFERYHTNIVVEVLDGKRGHDLRIRRCQVFDAYNTVDTHSQGVYVSWVDDILLEENLIDHNGWREGVPGAVPTIFRHNTYIQANCSGLRAVGNIISSGGSHGLQARPGGLVENNLFVNNAIALLLGTTWDTVGPVRFIARRNVVLQGRDITAALPRGWGIEVVAAEAGTVEQNIVANQGTGNFPIAMSIFDGNPAGSVHRVVIQDNAIYDWHGPIIMQGSPPQVTELTFRRNIVSEGDTNALLINHFSTPSPSFIQSQNNQLWNRVAPTSAWCRIGGSNVSATQWAAALADVTTEAARPDFFAPTRTLGDYEQHLGGPNSFQAFLNEARLMTKQRWSENYTAKAVNDWIRDGFRSAH